MDKLIAITYPRGNCVNYGYDQYGSVSAIIVSRVDASGTGFAFAADTALLSGLSYNADLLLSFGASVALKNEFEQTALDAATLGKKEVVCEMLRKWRSRKPR